MSATGYERGQLIGQMVVLLETIANDPSIPRSYTGEARRLIEEADEIWGRTT